MSNVKRRDDVIQNIDNSKVNNFIPMTIPETLYEYHQEDEHIKNNKQVKCNKTQEQ